MIDRDFCHKKKITNKTRGPKFRTVDSNIDVNRASSIQEAAPHHFEKKNVLPPVSLRTSVV